MADGAPDVTILVPDLRSPTVGAAVRMRELLAPAKVEIVGPDFGGGVCAMYRNSGPFVTVPTRRLYRWPEFLWESRKLDRAVRGRWVVAFKAYLNTIPVALRMQARGRARAAVFLDEWDGATLSEMTRAERLLRFAQRAFYPLDDIYHSFVERRIREASLVLVTTTALQRRFGGYVIALGVDTDRFKPPDPEATAKLRAELGLAGRKIIGFGGVVRPHKGLETVLEALVQLNHADAVLLVIGPVTDHLKSLMDNPRYTRFIRVAGAPLNDREGVNARIHANMPDYLGLADCLAIPLNDTPLSRSQMPIKVFEAMAMGKPILASAVGDLPEVLADIAWLVPPNDPTAMARALDEIWSDPSRARDRGMRARERCVANYSLKIGGSRLRKLLEFEESLS